MTLQCMRVSRGKGWLFQDLLCTTRASERAALLRTRVCGLGLSGLVLQYSLSTVNPSK